MSIVAKFQLTDIRKVTPSDKAPIYVFEAVDNNKGPKHVQLGIIKLRIKNPRAQEQLKNQTHFMVELTPVE